MFCDEKMAKLLSDRYFFITMFRIFSKFYFKNMLSLQWRIISGNVYYVQNVWIQRLFWFLFSHKIFSMNLFKYWKIRIRKKIRTWTVFLQNKIQSEIWKKRKSRYFVYNEKDIFPVNVWLIWHQYSIFIPPKNIRKTPVFWRL